MLPGRPRHRSLSGRVAAVLLVLLATACPKSPRNGNGAPARPGTIELFFTTELKGYLEPCGCTSDPLGDLARTAALIAEAKKVHPVALFDGGSTLYTYTQPPETMVAQEERKAGFLVKTLPTLGLAAAGLGPHDLTQGFAKVALPRQAANVIGAGLPLEPPRVVDVGGVPIGVFGVVGQTALGERGTATGLTVSDPAAAARQAIDDLRRQGARIVVALAHMPRRDARALASAAPGIDFLLVGQKVDLDLPAPEKVGTAWLIQPGDQGQVIARMELGYDPAGTAPFVDAIGEARAAELVTALDERIARLERDLATWEKDPEADVEFVKRKRDEVGYLKKERDSLKTQPRQLPARGSWFVLDLVRIKKQLPCDLQIQSAKQELDETIAQANLAAATAAPDHGLPAPVKEGESGYVGVEECASCHQEAVDFWKRTRHARAWETLVDVKKELDRSCISCHVTGWEKPGGATLVANEPLRDVQCEVCHGPGSRHADAMSKKERAGTITLAPAKDLCASQCHTKEHSDTFLWDAYMRDVTGEGHAAAFRARLGTGPTGHELRSAALERVGKEKGAGCSK